MGEETPQARLSAQWREQANADDARLRRYAYQGEFDGDLLDEDIELAFARNAERRRCADELDALQRQLCEEKTDEDSHTRMVDFDPLALQTPRPPEG